MHGDVYTMGETLLFARFPMTNYYKIPRQTERTYGPSLVGSL